MSFGWGNAGDDKEKGGFGWEKGGTVLDEIESGRKPDTSLPDYGWDKGGDTTGGFGWGS